MPRPSPGGQHGDRRACRQVDIAPVADSLRALAAPSYAPHIESSTQRVDNRPEREERNQMASSGPDKGIAKIAKIAKIDDDDTEGHIAKIAKIAKVEGDDTEGHIAKVAKVAKVAKIAKAEGEDTSGHIAKIAKADSDRTGGNIAKIAKIAKADGGDTEGHIAEIAKATPSGERDIARVDPPTEDRYPPHDRWPLIDGAALQGLHRSDPQRRAADLPGSGAAWCCRQP